MAAAKEEQNSYSRKRRRTQAGNNNHARPTSMLLLDLRFGWFDAMRSLKMDNIGRVAVEQAGQTTKMPKEGAREDPPNVRKICDHSQSWGSCDNPSEGTAQMRFSDG